METERDKSLVDPVTSGHGMPRLAVPVGVVLYLTALTAFLRAPSLFPAVINWDESTYMLVGRSLLAGNLPYVAAWEIKPPLAFLPFAAFLSLPMSGVVAVRLGGALYVIASAVLVYACSREVASHRAGVLAGTLFVTVGSVVGAGHATMTEHLAILPLLGALWWLIRARAAYSDFFVAGALMGLAGMTRINLAYCALIVGLYVVSVDSRPLGKRGALHICAYGLGGTFVVCLTALPYLVQGHARVWWSSVVLAHLEFSRAYDGVGEAFVTYVSNMGEAVVDLRGWDSGLQALLWIGGIAGLGVLGWRWSGMSHAGRRASALLLVFLAGTSLAILESGAIRQHYLIQVTPFFAVLAGLFLDALLSTPARLVAVPVLTLCLVMPLRPALVRYERMWGRLAEGRPMVHGPAVDIASYLARQGEAGEDVWLTTDHLAYLLLDAEPPSRIIHPTVLGRAFLLRHALGPQSTPETEVSRILETKPAFIVVRATAKYLGVRPRARELLTRALRTDYTVAARIRGRVVYRRRSLEEGGTLSADG